MKLAVEFGYHPNRSAAGLATGKAGAIGFVQRLSSGFGPNMTEFLGGLASRLESRQIDILVSVVDDKDGEFSVYRRLAASKRVDAVILHTPTVNDERMELLKRLGLPFVLHGRGEVGGGYPWLDIDNFGLAHRSTRHLIDLGHRRIGLINGPKGEVFAEHREQGFRKAHAERGLAVNPALVANGIFVDDVGYRAMQDFLAHPEPPTAVFASSMMTALGVLRAIRSAGLTIGRDISVIAHDDVFTYINADNMVPTLSTTRSSMRAAGVRVGDFVLQMLSGQDVSAQQEVWPVELILRESTAPPPSAGV